MRFARRAGLEGMLLENRTATIYGGGGAIGGAIARACAAEGAHVHLAGRTTAPLKAVAADIRGAGGAADTATLDALDERAVDEHVAAIGRFDLSVNVIGHPYAHGTDAAALDVTTYLEPVGVATRTAFLTWRAAARHLPPSPAIGAPVPPNARMTPPGGRWRAAARQVRNAVRVATPTGSR